MHSSKRISSPCAVLESMIVQKLSSRDCLLKRFNTRTINSSSVMYSSLKYHTIHIDNHSKRCIRYNSSSSSSGSHNSNNNSSSSTSSNGSHQGQPHQSKSQSHSGSSRSNTSGGNKNNNNNNNNNNNSSNNHQESYWNAYCRLLNEKPLITKSITSGVLSFVANLICQTNEQYFSIAKEKQKSKQLIKEGKDTNGNGDDGGNNNNDKDIDSNIVVSILSNLSDIKYDWLRVARFSTLGLCVVGPTLHFWFKLLISKFPGTYLLPTVQRLAMDQLVFAPIFLPCFISLDLVLQGRSDDILNTLQAEGVNMIIANWSLWVPCQFMNFKFVPAPFQVLFSNMIGFIWNVYLSSIMMTKQDIIIVPTAAIDTTAGEAEAEEVVADDGPSIVPSDKIAGRSDINNNDDDDDDSHIHYKNDDDDDDDDVSIVTKKIDTKSDDDNTTTISANSSNDSTSSGTHVVDADGIAPDIIDPAIVSSSNQNHHDNSTNAAAADDDDDDVSSTDVSQMDVDTINNNSSHDTADDIKDGSNDSSNNSDNGDDSDNRSATTQTENGR